MSPRPKQLLDNIEALKRKTEQNREQAKEAKEAADAATGSSKDAETVRLQTQTLTRRQEVPQCRVRVRVGVIVEADMCIVVKCENKKRAERSIVVPGWGS